MVTHLLIPSVEVVGHAGGVLEGQPSACRIYYFVLEGAEHGECGDITYDSSVIPRTVAKGQNSETCYFNVVRVEETIDRFTAIDVRVWLAITPNLVRGFFEVQVWVLEQTLAELPPQYMFVGIHEDDETFALTTPDSQTGLEVSLEHPTRVGVFVVALDEVELLLIDCFETLRFGFPHTVSHDNSSDMSRIIVNPPGRPSSQPSKIVAARADGLDELVKSYQASASWEVAGNAWCMTVMC